MRPIDADAVIDEMSEKHRPNFHEDLKSYHMWIMWYWALKNAPTIDAVSIDDYRSMEKTCYKLQKALYEKADAESVVRCKECKYWRNTDAEKIPTASIACGSMHADDYCSYGEREGE